MVKSLGKTHTHTPSAMSFFRNSVRDVLFLSGGRGAGGSRSKNLLERGMKQRLVPEHNLRLLDEAGSWGTKSWTQDQKTRTVSTCCINPGGLSLRTARLQTKLMYPPPLPAKLLWKEFAQNILDANVATPADPRGGKEMNIWGGEKLLEKCRWSMFKRPERGLTFFGHVSDPLSDIFFLRFFKPLFVSIKTFSRAISFCKRAALT